MTTEQIAVCHAQPLPSEGEVPDRIHLLPFGTFTGRNGEGPWTVRDKNHAARIIANTSTYQGGADIPVDYEHAAVLAAPKGQPAPAAGWLKSLEVGPNGIWGKVEWTSAAAQKIGDREYRYISPVFIHDLDGTVMRIASAALVGFPNLELTALNSQGVTMPPDTMTAAKALLGLDGADDQSFLKAIGDLSTLASAFCKALKLPPDTPAAGLLDALMQNSNGDSVEACCSASIGKGAPKLAMGKAEIPPGYVHMSALRAISDEADQLRGQLSAVSVEKAVQAALSQGSISPAMKDWATALCSSNPQSFNEFLTKIPPAFAHLGKSPFEGKSAIPTNSSHASGLSDHQLAICSQLNISPDAFAKNISE